MVEIVQAVDYDLDMNMGTLMLDLNKTVDILTMIISDKAGTTVEAVPSNDSMSVRLYTPDTTGLVLHSYFLNLTSEIPGTQNKIRK